ncbi:hypothetical protein TNCV_1072241 [Trichonephila clavipes]|nr:hypothetical protein TNCV_1072241 [Trichonephila clavipes]
MSVVLKHSQETILLYYTRPRLCVDLTKGIQSPSPQHSLALPKTKDSLPLTVLSKVKHPLTLKNTLTPPKSHRFAPTFHNPRQQ